MFPGSTGRVLFISNMSLNAIMLTASRTIADGVNQTISAAAVSHSIKIGSAISTVSKCDALFLATIINNRVFGKITRQTTPVVHNSGQLSRTRCPLWNKNVSRAFPRPTYRVPHGTSSGWFGKLFVVRSAPRAVR